VLVLPIVFKCLDRLRRPIERAGVDFEQLRAIVEIKLALDLRSASRSRESFLTGGLVLLMVVAWFAGFPAGAAALFKVSPIMWMAAVQATVGLLLGFVLLTQYGPMLVDATDLGVMAHRPVSDRTLFAARLVHISVYVVALLLPTMFWPAFLGGFGYPFWAVIVCVPVLSTLTALFVIGLVALMYAVALRVAGPARFQRFALWVQIAVTAMGMGGSQLFPALAKSSGMNVADVAQSDAVFFLPPFHSGGCFALVLGDGTSCNVVLSLLALLLPVVAGLLALQLASRHFIAGLAGAFARETKRRAGWTRGLLARFGDRVAKTRVARAGYGYACALARRERMFLRAAWPPLIGLTFAIVGLTLQSLRNDPELARTVLPFTLYCGPPVVVGTVEVSRLAEHAKARWIFGAHPIESSREITGAALLGVLAVSAIPFYGLVTVAALVIAGPARALDIVLALELSILLSLHRIRRLTIMLPFTVVPRPNEMNVANFFVMLGTLLYAVGAAVVHLLVRLHPVSLVAAIVVAGLLLVRARRVFEGLESRLPEE
jgi:hypothetical protein